MAAAAAEGGDDGDAKNDLSRVYRAITEDGADADEVRRILEEKYSTEEQRKAAVNYTTKNGNEDDTAIGAAVRLCRAGNSRGPALVGLLLEAGADPSNLRPLYLSNPIALAIAFGQVEALRGVLKSGRHDANAKIDAQKAARYRSSTAEPFRCSAVHLCLVPPTFTPHTCQANCDPNLACLELLVREFGADVNQPDSDGYPPLSWVPLMRRDHEAAVDLLLSAGADPVAEAAEDRAPIVALCFLSDKPKFKDHAVPCLRKLVAAGARVTGLPGTASPPLCAAAVAQNEDVVRFLVEQHGAPPSEHDPVLGDTALHHCIWGGPIPSLLLAKGAAINAQAALDGQTPLHRCAQAGSCDGMELLLDRGASPDVKDNDGNTPMMIACSLDPGFEEWSFHESTETAELLLRHSSRDTLRATRPSDGYSAVDCIVQGLRESEGPLIQSYLEEFGWDTDDKEDGHPPIPPLHAHLNTDHCRVLCGLLEAGAPVRPENAAVVLPVLQSSSLLRRQERAAIEMAFRRRPSNRWRGEDEIVQLAFDVVELREAEEGVRRREAHVRELEEELRRRGGEEEEEEEEEARRGGEATGGSTGEGEDGGGDGPSGGG